VLAGRGPDVLVGGRGRDWLFGGAGNDQVIAQDRTPDHVDGGPGRDLGTFDRSDRIRLVERRAYTRTTR
jgi:hypothetical protein